MMTKWDSIQEDIKPIEPKFWGDENEFQDEDELSFEELSDEQVDKYLTLDWNE